MSDTAAAASTAPTSSPLPAAPSAAPAHPGLVIDPNPVAVPNPIGPQTGEAPTRDIQGSPHRPQSRREVIADAFRKAEAAGRPEAAKPRIGHNQPPEPIGKDKTPPKKGEVSAKPSDTPLNLRKRPTSEPGQAPELERPRGEHGHFAPRQGQTESGPPLGLPAGSQPSQSSPFAQPPQRMAEAAKRDWAVTPETVRAEVHRAHREFANAYQAMRADREVMNTLRPYQQMAQQQGITLAWALNNYKTIEDRLRGDPIGGLEQIVWNMNLWTKPTDGQQPQRITLRDLAFHIATQSPEQHQARQVQNHQLSLQAQMQQQQQQMAWLAEQNRRMQEQARYNYLRRGVDWFAKTHPRLDELAPAIEQELKLGFPLKVAYMRADRLYPQRPGQSHQATAAQTRTETTAAQTRTQATAAQTRKQSNRSISGAPDGGSRAPISAYRTNGKVPTRREALADAFRQVGGGL